MQVRVRIHHSGARLEKGIAKWDFIRIILIGEERVSVDEERRTSLRMETQNALDILSKIFSECTLRRWERGAQDPERMSSRDRDLFVQSEVREGFVHGLHGGEEVGHELSVVPG